MIKFEIKDKKTGKTSTYKKDGITIGEAEKFYETIEKMNEEAEKEDTKSSDVRKIERSFFVGLFSDQGLTEDDVLNNMTTREYKRVSDEIFREIKAEDEEDSKDASEEVGKTEKQSQ
ncbi:TPA: hypothetical protein I1490_000231 [Staphylococcus pseudintermedius]|nr:hypothetical protein [Staphylococcus pseudintermedius]